MFCSSPTPAQELVCSSVCYNSGIYIAEVASEIKAQ
jgi:hypothetical protein